MAKVRKMVVVGLVVLSVLVNFGFCANEINPDPPHSIIYTIGK